MHFFALAIGLGVKHFMCPWTRTLPGISIRFFAISQILSSVRPVNMWTVEAEVRQGQGSPKVWRDAHSFNFFCTDRINRCTVFICLMWNMLILTVFEA